MPKKYWHDLTNTEIVEAVRNITSNEQIEAAGSPTLVASLVEERITDPEIKKELLGKIASFSKGERKG